MANIYEGAALRFRVCSVVLIISRLIALAGGIEAWIGPATADFGSRLVKQLASEEPGTNICVSPFSIQGCFGLIYPGGASTTATEIQSALAYPADATKEKIHVDLIGAQWPSFNGSRESPSEPANPTLSIGYRVYVHNDTGSALVLAPAYGDLVGPLVTTADLTQASAAVAINDWVNNETLGKIPSIVPVPLTGDTKLLAVNTVYLKAQWTEPFDEARTYWGPFLSTAGAVTVENAHYMTKVGKYLYSKTEQHQFVHIPLHGGLSVGFAVTLCRAEYGAGEVDIVATRALAKQQRLALAIPKFEFESSYTPINSALKSLGITTAFTDAADFSAMIDSSSDVQALMIDKVIHKTFIAVDEGGVEAAAATSIAMQTTSIDNSVPKLLLADRPFDFVIYEETSSIVLFQGRVELPSPKQGATNPAAGQFKLHEAFNEFVEDDHCASVTSKASAMSTLSMVLAWSCCLTFV